MCQSNHIVYDENREYRDFEIGCSKCGKTEILRAEIDKVDVALEKAGYDSPDGVSLLCKECIKKAKPQPTFVTQAKPPPADPMQHLVRMIRYASIKNQLCKAKMCLPGGKEINLYAIPIDVAGEFQALFDKIARVDGDKMIREIYQKPESN